MNKTLALYVEAYKGLSRQTWWLSLVMLINRSGTMVVPFLTIYLTQHLHYSIAQAGYVMGIYGIGSVTGALLGGKLTDGIGFYAVQLMALCAGGIMFVVLGQVHSLLHIYVATFILSMLNEAFRPANAAAIAAYSTAATVIRSFSLNRLSINLGWSAGSALGGLIASFDFSWLFWIDGLTNIGAAVLLLIFLPFRSIKNFRMDKKEQDTGSPALAAHRDKTYLYFILLTTVFAVCFFQMFTLLPVYYKQELQLPVNYIGIIMAINGLLIAVFEMIIVFKLEGRRRNTWYISAGVFMVGLSFIVLNLPFIPAAWMAFTSMLFITFGEILAMPFLNSFWISRTVAQNRGQYASLYTVSYALAQIIAPTMGAAIVNAGGFMVLWWVIGAISCINSLLFMYMKKESPSVEILMPAK